MSQVYLEPWLLQASLWGLLAAAVLLLGTIAAARVSRRRRARRQAAGLSSVRRDILQVAAGDDQDGAAYRRLDELTGDQFEVITPTLVGLLSKVRGRPAAAISRLLTSQGAVNAALIGIASSSASRRARSAWMVGLLRRDRSVHRVIPLLQDRDRGAAVTAARALGMLGDPRAAAPLLDAVPAAPRGRGGLPAWVVTEALARLGPGAAPVLGQALERQDATTRAVAAAAIGLGQHISQTGRLRGLVQHETSPEVLAAAAQALGLVGSSRDLESLRPLTAESHPRSVRAAAVRAVGEIGGPQARDLLTTLLADPDPRIGDLAATRLCRQGQAGLAELRALTAAGQAQGSPEASRARASARYGLVLDGLRRPGPAEGA